MIAAASAKGCLGGCLELGLSLALKQEQELATLLGGALMVLGQNVGNVLPYSYTSADNTLSLDIHEPNFSAPLKQVAGKTGPATHTSTQTLATGAVDVAQLIANLIGLPLPLSGSVGGFGYTLIEALVGLGLELERWFKLEAAKLYTSLAFSAPVVISTDGVNWSEAKTSFTPEPGTAYEIRPVNNATTLGIVPSYGFYTNLEASLDLVPFFFGSVRALEVYGHGVSFGPLLKDLIKQPLAHFEFDSYQTQRSKWVTGQPINLTFDPLVVDANNQPIGTLCPNLGDCLATGFIPITTARDGGWRSSEIVLARNLTGACLLGILDDPDSPCDLDPVFVPLRYDFREGASRTDPIEFTPRYDTLRSILGAADPVPGPESDAGIIEASVRDAIARLGFDPDAEAFPRRAPWGDPAPTAPIVGDTVYLVNITAVPEPSTFALLAVGVLMLLYARARQAVGL